jgi:prevent-host-death family protein
MQSSLARQNFRTVLTRVEHGNETITFTRHGEPVAVIIPVELYERLTGSAATDDRIGTEA